MNVNVFPNKETYKCTFLVFEQYGILCKHILCVMKSNFKNIIRHEELLKSHCNCIADNISGCERVIQDAYSIITDCINVIGHDAEAMAQFLQWQKEIRTKVEQKIIVQ
uniref:Zinc finger PMZ-type domain-containing protein n=1 Tax=Lactuca sativa TaxID=4236 RepID=A0A9R1VW93_LACSA|nr:hypothetical protein LSAT_V11C400213900 [Lactuca sativa]